LIFFAIRGVEKLQARAAGIEPRFLYLSSQLGAYDLSATATPYNMQRRCMRNVKYSRWEKKLIVLLNSCKMELLTEIQNTNLMVTFKVSLKPDAQNNTLFCKIYFTGRTSNIQLSEFPR